MSVNFPFINLHIHPCFCRHWISGSWRRGFFRDPVPPLVFWNLNSLDPKPFLILAQSLRVLSLHTCPRGNGLLPVPWANTEYCPSPRSLKLLFHEDKGAKQTSAPPSEPSHDGGFVLSSPAFSLALESLGFPEDTEGRYEFPSWIKVPVALHAQANAHSAFLSYYLLGGPPYLPPTKEKWCSHHLSLEVPIFPKNSG